MPTLFVSDLHLHESRPKATDSFLRFLGVEAQGADELYILGDLFEAWIGDDDPDAHNRGVVAALRSYTAQGHRCRFICGNRDFLVRDRFAAETGVELLADEPVVSLYGERVLLMHGDQLCIDDHGYQRLRRIIRNRSFQAIYLALPLAARRVLGRELRNRSEITTDSKSAAITDAVQTAVEAAMRRHQVRMLVHGHTHRPATHSFQLDGDQATRIVLGDWYTQASVLRWDASGYELRSRPFV